MNRSLIVFLSAWLLVVGLACRVESATDGSPEQVVRSFYGWYVPTHSDGDLLGARRGELARFVTASFLKRIDRLLKIEGGLEADPFLEAQDYDAEWGKRIAVRNVQIQGAAATVNVELISKAMGSHRLRVALSREDGIWKLDRVTAKDR